MIAIVNVGPFNDPNPMGERNYEVRINQRVITTFKHKRSDGLARCLLEASKSVEKEKWAGSPIHEMIQGFQEKQPTTHENG